MQMFLVKARCPHFLSFRFFFFELLNVGPKQFCIGNSTVSLALIVKVTLHSKT